jgi:hypothetical protein
MKSYAPQNVVDAAAFLLASHIAVDESKEWINEFVAGIGKSYRRSYRDDDWFENDVRHCAEYAEQAARSAYSDQTTRAHFLRYCYELVRRVEPDGSPRKKFLGVFGGTLFRPGHAHPADRKMLFEANCARYFVMAGMSGVPSVSGTSSKGESSMFGFGKRQQHTDAEIESAIIHAAANLTAKEDQNKQVAQQREVEEIVKDVCSRRRLTPSNEEHRLMVSAVHSLAGTEIITNMMKRWVAEGGIKITASDIRETMAELERSVAEFMKSQRK